MARGVISYGNKGPVDSEFRRQTNPNLRARSGAGATIAQVPITIDPEKSREDAMNQRITGTVGQASANWQKQMDDTLKALLGTSGGTSSKDALARAQFDYQRRQDALDRAFQERQFGYGQEQDALTRAFQQRQYEDELARQARSLGAMQQFYAGGGARTGMDSLLAAIQEQSGRSEAAVQDAYRRALANIAAGYQTAEGLTTQGYQQLEDFLGRNPSDVYREFRCLLGQRRMRWSRFCLRMGFRLSLFVRRLLRSRLLLSRVLLVSRIC